MNVSGLISATQNTRRYRIQVRKWKKERNILFYYHAVALFLLNRKSSVIDIKQSNRRGINQPNINTFGACGLFLSVSSKYLTAY